MSGRYHIVITDNETGEVQIETTASCICIGASGEKECSAVIAKGNSLELSTACVAGQIAVLKAINALPKRFGEAVRGCIMKKAEELGL